MAYSYKPVDRDQLFLMPPDMREWLPKAHLAWFVLDCWATRSSRTAVTLKIGLRGAGLRWRTEHVAEPNDDPLAGAKSGAGAAKKPLPAPSGWVCVRQSGAICGRSGP